MDTEIDFILEREAIDRQDRYWAMRDYCDRCEYHNESCPYYDENEESLDEQRCFRENDWGGDGQENAVDEPVNESHTMGRKRGTGMTYEQKSSIVISQLRADRDRLLDVLDKIIAEISAHLSNAEKDSNRTQDDLDIGICLGLRMALDTIGWYKAGSVE